MDKNLLNHYIETGTYTYAGPYDNCFKSLPSEIKELGNLICSQIIHPITLHQCDPKFWNEVVNGQTPCIIGAEMSEWFEVTDMSVETIPSQHGPNFL